MLMLLSLSHRLYCMYKCVHVEIVPSYFGSLDILVMQETIKEQVANMYLWPRTLEVQIMDPAK